MFNVYRKKISLFKNSNGFTLIELLIVIVIIGILATLIAGLIGRNARAKANDAKRKTDLHEIQNALENYHSDHNLYPNADTWEEDLTSSDPQYMTAIPTDPKGDDYTYSPSLDHTTYELSAVLENKNDKDPRYDSETGFITYTNKQL